MESYGISKGYLWNLKEYSGISIMRYDGISWNTVSSMEYDGVSMEGGCSSLLPLVLLYTCTPTMYISSSLSFIYISREMQSFICFRANSPTAGNWAA